MNRRKINEKKIDFHGIFLSNIRYPWVPVSQYSYPCREDKSKPRALPSCNCIK